MTAAATETYTLSLHDALPIFAVHHDDALLVEQVGHRARLAEVAAVLVERVADLRPGAVAVVGQRLHEDRHAARSAEHTSELQSHSDLVCRLLLEEKNRGDCAR